MSSYMPGGGRGLGHGPGLPPERPLRDLYKEIRSQMGIPKRVKAYRRCLRCQDPKPDAHLNAWRSCGNLCPVCPQDRQSQHWGEASVYCRHLNFILIACRLVRNYWTSPIANGGSPMQTFTSPGGVDALTQTNFLEERRHCRLHRAAGITRSIQRLLCSEAAKKSPPRALRCEKVAFAPVLPQGSDRAYTVIGTISGKEVGLLAWLVSLLHLGLTGV